MDYDALIKHITPEVYRSLKQSLELGKWPDGRKLSQQQKEATMEAIIAYEFRNVAEQERVGYLERGNAACDDAEVQPLNWKTTGRPDQ